MSERILVIEDDAGVQSFLETLLARAGYEPSGACDAAAAYRALFEVRPDLVILDIGLPVVDGWEVLSRIRQMTDVPVIILTARDTQVERIRGLQAGADDYVVKPFDRQELLARVRAVLRRVRPSGPAEGAPRVYVDDFLRLDLGEHCVEVEGRPVALSPLEFRLLTALLRRPGQLVAHDDLAAQAWGRADVSRDQVKLYISYLRRKLGIDPQGPLEAVRGFGYRYRPPRPVALRSP